tara:strand:- start:17106 stop:18029 length:924 start_codon:yes stop_codon:yes gene_type:complete
MIKKLAIFFFYFLIFPNNLLANLNNKIILKINNEIITSYELKNKIISTLILSNTEINQENINKLKKQSLESLINNKLKYLEISKYKVESNKNQLNNYLNSISKNNLEKLKEEFEEYNLDFKMFVEEIETQLKWQKFIYNIYSKKIILDYEAIDKEVYNLNKNLNVEEELNLSEIEILRGNKADNESISKLIEKINSIGFEKAALSESVSNTSDKNGKLGWISSKSLNEQIFKNVNGLKVGEISKPIIRADSILILKLNDRRKLKKEKIDLTKLKQNLIDKKKNDLFNLYSNSHLSKLKNSSFIEYLK